MEHLHYLLLDCFVQVEQAVEHCPPFQQAVEQAVLLRVQLQRFFLYQLILLAVQVAQVLQQQDLLEIAHHIVRLEICHLLLVAPAGALQD